MFTTRRSTKPSFFRYNVSSLNIQSLRTRTHFVSQRWQVARRHFPCRWTSAELWCEALASSPRVRHWRQMHCQGDRVEKTVMGGGLSRARFSGACQMWASRVAEKSGGTQHRRTSSICIDKNIFSQKCGTPWTYGTKRKLLLVLNSAVQLKIERRGLWWVTGCHEQGFLEHVKCELHRSWAIELL